MVEGPFVHMTAQIHQVLLVGKAFVATSPSGRFAEGAAAINGRYVAHIDAHGKHIFYVGPLNHPADAVSKRITSHTFFTRQKLEKTVLAKLPDDVVVVHIHFGMSGSFRTFDYPGPEPREKTRLRLHSEEEKIEAHLSASVCVQGDIELYRKTISKLGPDPLRADADKEIVWRKMQITRKTVGSMLMDQSLVAGIGNVYRAEILFLSGLHPDQRASTLSRSAFEKIWEQSVQLLWLGMVTGSIATVSPEDDAEPYHHYVYKQSICKGCGGAIRRWASAGRTVYACEVCQPLKEIKEKIVDKTLVDDALSREQQTSKAQVDTDVTDSPGIRKSSLHTKITMTSMKDYRKRRFAADKIVEKELFKDITSERLWDFSSRLAGPTSSKYDLSTHGKGSLRNSPIEKARWRRKHHSQASECARVLHARNAPCVRPNWTNEYFQTRRVGCNTLQVLGTVKPQARIGLYAMGKGRSVLGSTLRHYRLNALVNMHNSWE